MKKVTTNNTGSDSADEPYVQLAYAIVRRAAKDYKNVKKNIGKPRKDYYARLMNLALNLSKELIRREIL